MQIIKELLKIVSNLDLTMLRSNENQYDPQFKERRLVLEEVN